MSELVLESVTKRYGDVVGVDDVSVTIGGGQYHALVGPNGSGKTTIVRLLVGLVQPTMGQVSRTAVSVGCGFQRPNFYPDLTVAENLDVFASMVGPVESTWREQVLDGLRLGPARHRLAGDLSGGFARKLDLALAVLKRPDVLLLDEPLGALDDVSTASVLEFLADFNAAGNTILVSTHNITDFEPWLDRVTIMFDGSIVADEMRGSLDWESGSSLQDYYVEQILERER